MSAVTQMIVPPLILPVPLKRRTLNVFSFLFAGATVKASGISEAVSTAK
jgi:hypothetical protein